MNVYNTNIDINISHCSFYVFFYRKYRYNLPKSRLVSEIKLRRLYKLILSPDLF